MLESFRTWEGAYTCEHFLSEDAQLTPAENHNHFRFCLTHDGQIAQLEQWRDAADKWWDHLTRPAKVESMRAHPPIDVEPADMCVHVVLPGGNVLSLASQQPVAPEILGDVSRWERTIMVALLQHAISELHQYPPAAVPQLSPYPAY